MHQHPDVTMDCIAMGRSMRAWEAGEHQSIRATLAQHGAAGQAIRTVEAVMRE